MNDKKKLLIGVRKALLIIVDEIECYLGIDRTRDLRRAGEKAIRKDNENYAGAVNQA